MGVWGLALSVGGDGGPSYRAQWEEELTSRGIFIEHGGIQHPQSQGIAEKKVGLFKECLEKNPARPSREVQALVNALNMREGYPAGVGTPAQRMFNRDLSNFLPTLPHAAPVVAVQLRDKLAASRDRAMGRQKNNRPLELQIGDHCWMWDQRAKRYSLPVTVQAPNQGMDGASCSYWVMDDRNRGRLVHVSWLVKAPNPEDLPVEQIDV